MRVPQPSPAVAGRPQPDGHSFLSGSPPLPLEWLSAMCRSELSPVGSWGGGLSAARIRSMAPSAGRWIVPWGPKSTPDVGETRPLRYRQTAPCRPEIPPSGRADGSGDRPLLAHIATETGPIVPDDKERRLLALGQAHVLSHRVLPAGRWRCAPWFFMQTTQPKVFPHTTASANACGQPVHVAFGGPGFLAPAGLERIARTPEFFSPAVGGPL